MSTTSKKVKRAKYPSDISKNGWKRLQKTLPISQHQRSGTGRPPADLKEVINAIFYVVKTGCSWRSLPHDFPCWPTVYGYFNRWSRDGTWQVVLRTDKQKGFKVLPRRWVVERTFAWILNARRLSMDYEKTRKSSQSMVYLAMLPLMIRRLT